MPVWSLAALRAFRSQRVRSVERMDQRGLPKAERDAALAGLDRLSAWPGQRGPLLAALQRLLGRPSAQRRRLIELGAGSGHLSAWLQGRLRSRGHRLDVVATDRRGARGVKALDALGPLPKADIYFSNLLLHHLDDRDAAKSLQAQARASRLGLAHYELQRHWAHYYGAAALLPLARMPAIVQGDGLRSIQQGYHRAELAALAAGLPGASVHWRFPCRWLLTWRR